MLCLQAQEVDFLDPDMGKRIIESHAFEGVSSRIQIEFSHWITFFGVVRHASLQMLPDQLKGVMGQIPGSLVNRLLECDRAFDGGADLTV